MMPKINGRGGFAAGDYVVVDTIQMPTSIGRDGRLEDPIVLTSHRSRVDLETIHNQDGLDTSVYVTVSGVPRLVGHPNQPAGHPGNTLLWAGDWNPREEYGFIYQGYGDREGDADGSSWPPSIALTQRGLYAHDYFKRYHFSNLRDYSAYDFYPWNEEVPWGSPTEEWEFRIRRTYAGGDPSGAITLSFELRGSEHPGVTYTAADLEVCPEGHRGETEPNWDWGLKSWHLGYAYVPASYFTTFPIGMTLVAARIVFEGVSEVLPVVDTFTITSPVSPGDYGRWWTSPLTLTASDTPPNTVDGYYVTEEGAPQPLPLDGVYSATAPVEFSAGQGYGREQFPTGPRTIYAWVRNNTRAVSLRAEAQVFFIDSKVDEIPMWGNPMRTQRHYIVGQTELYEPGIIGMVTPNMSDVITVTLTGGQTDLFELVGYAVRFKVAPTDASVDAYSLVYRVEDEHGNSADGMLHILNPSYIA